VPDPANRDPWELDSRRGVGHGKARIPLFKQFMGTDETPMARYIGAMSDFHWNDHAGQLAEIRQEAGLPAAT
jgi:hypothetical protein